jgi:hypothetical protein
MTNHLINCCFLVLSSYFFVPLINLKINTSWYSFPYISRDSRRQVITFPLIFGKLIVFIYLVGKAYILYVVRFPFLDKTFLTHWNKLIYSAHGNRARIFKLVFKYSNSLDYSCLIILTLTASVK